MKFFFRNSDRRAELSALVTIAIVLAIVAAAKLDAGPHFSTPLADFAQGARRSTSHIIRAVIQRLRRLVGQLSRLIFMRFLYIFGCRPLEFLCRT